jgi:hypothetical protein
MTLIATVGAVDANSYAEVEEADAYFETRVNSTKWVNTLDKEAALISASLLLDWQLIFDGFKTSNLQARQFPRTGIIKSGEYEVPSDIIPIEVKQAVFELAYSSIGVDRIADNSLSGIEQIKAGSLFIKATPAGVQSTNASIIPDYIKRMLSEYIVSSGIGVVRLMRA